MNLEKIKIIITGHPYAFPYYFRLFDYFRDLDRFIFVLPRVWKSRVTIKPEKKIGYNIIRLRTWSYGSGSFLGGAFKGWLPGLLWLIPYLKIRCGIKVLYSCSEPNLLTTLFNGLLAKLFGLKFVIFTWQNVEPEKRLSDLKLKLSNCLVALNLKLADGIICGNKKAEVIVKRFDRNLTTLICPLSGVDIEKFKPNIPTDWKEKLYLGSSKMILFYGVLDGRKGLDILIRAFGTLAGRFIDLEDCKLVIVGAGPKKEELIRLSENLKIGDSIKFLDWMKNYNLPELLNAADVFAYPSLSMVNGWEEQFGYAMAEAEACGIPVVATATGSIGEVVNAGVTGILVKPGDPDVLAEALGKILMDENMRAKMGIAARDYVVKNFSHKVVAEKIEDFLNDLHRKT